MFQSKKNLSSPLKLGRAASKPRGRGKSNQTNTAYENCNWLARKTWSIQAASFLPLKKISRHLLRADVSKYRPEVYKTEKSKILKKIHKVALGKLLT